jgi:hypothetical protein
MKKDTFVETVKKEGLVKVLSKISITLKFKNSYVEFINSKSLIFSK